MDGSFKSYLANMAIHDDVMMSYFTGVWQVRFNEDENATHGR